MNTVDGYHKSSYSGESGHCVEVAEGPRTRVRDTRNRTLGHLEFEASEWAVLLSALTR
ncbi:DUF397 domain-containing protein [Nocardiopsis flavescens]|uniref:DUF397 domain-containing protein n=1 Tax=Nocardiopsis flavescens TaxID=758803 RepID=A0A1M6D0Z5_9ACTN|nr:DUF397 domain-containing protein [Nocardiopsis flavescens]SHI66648.1 protein of unknown function [Nocardiopsis flavescens]